MSDERFDLVVIGGGPGGYVAAIRAAQLGLKTACIEKRGTLGGTCLNIGCIPSKALLHASETYAEAREKMAALGVMAADVSLDLTAMMGHKEATVNELTQGIEHLFKKNDVTYVNGAGKIVGQGQVEVTAESGETTTVAADSIIIATGSAPATLPDIEIDEERVVSSTGALSLSEVPKHLVVIGGGYIGLEMGSVWRRLGAEVTVVEALDRVLPGCDGEVSKAFARVLRKQGFTVKTATKVTGVKKNKKSLKVSVVPAGGGKEETLDADRVLMAVGRRPFTEALGLESAGIEPDDNGCIPIDDHFRTRAPGVYAIGDVVRGPMLAHKAAEEGVACAEIIAGKAGHVNYDAIPAVVFTQPEIAQVGKTEEELKAAGIAYRVGKFPFAANAKAKVDAATDGFVKILADAETDRVLGVHIIGKDAGNLIAEAALAIEFMGSAEDVALTCHAHPTLSEALKEAALGVAERSIHI